jgi:hypothetical protein
MMKLAHSSDLSVDIQEVARHLTNQFTTLFGERHEA